MRPLQPGAANFRVGSSFIAIERASQLPPVATAARSNKVIAVNLSLESSMVRRTSRARSAAGADRAPPAA